MKIWNIEGKIMKKLMAQVILVLLVMVFALPASAKNKKYVYRKRAEWVKINKLSNKQLAGVTLTHPASITSNKITEILMSIDMNKGQLLKKDIKMSEVFSAEEARKYGPLITKALNRASPNEIVNVLVVHKRPHFILRSDYISIFNVYKTDEGVHFHFTKLFAKLVGDYEQASMLDKSIRQAKSLRVSLASKPGQVLSTDGKEIVVSLDQDFSTNTSVATEESEDKKNIVEKEVIPQVAGIETANSEPVYDVKTRLLKLESLKKDKLISTAEYKEMRKEILDNL